MPVFTAGPHIFLFVLNHRTWCDFDVQRMLLGLCLIMIAACGDADKIERSTPTAKTTPLKISTFNLKFYGSGGGFLRRGVEPRSRYLPSFIKQELKTSDVVMFSEVVDVPLLTNNLKDLWDCVSYNDSTADKTGWHQHLVFCYDRNRYRVEKYDEDYILPEHALGSRGLRPALQLKLCHLKGDCFVQIVGIHLKAGRATDRRIKQMETLAVDFQKHKDLLPTILTGDFNSYTKDRSGKDKDDIEIFEDLLSRDSVKFRSLTKGIPTFGSGDKGRAYDHVVASQSIQLVQLKSYEACGKETPSSSNVLDYASYKKNFSDHCYVTTELQIPAKNI